MCEWFRGSGLRGAADAMLGLKQRPHCCCRKLLPHNHGEELQVALAHEGPGRAPLVLLQQCAHAELEELLLAGPAPSQPTPATRESSGRSPGRRWWRRRRRRQWRPPHSLHRVRAGARHRLGSGGFHHLRLSSNVRSSHHWGRLSRLRRRLWVGGATTHAKVLRPPMDLDVAVALVASALVILGL